MVLPKRLLSILILTDFLRALQRMKCDVLHYIFDKIIRFFGEIILFGNLLEVKNKDV